MLPDALIDRTLSRFPRLEKDKIQIQALEKGGSDRRYYRIRVTGKYSLILVKYGDQREENRHYVEIAQFLQSIEVRAPEIYFHDETEGLIWMEDLGEVDLWACRDRAWESLAEL